MVTEYCSTGGPDSPDYYKYIVTFGDGSPFSGGHRFQITNQGKIYAVLGKTGGPPAYDYHTTFKLTLNTWQLFAWTHNANALVYYLDGTTESDTNAIAFTAAKSGNFRVGCRASDPVQFNYDGRLGPIAVWDRALSTAELDTYRNGGAGLTYAQLT